MGLNVNTVTVIGANGTMGTNVAGIFASFGNAKVYLVSRDIEKARQAMENAAKSVKADSIKANMEAADYSQLSECVKNSDLIFESVAENMEIKSEVLRIVAENANSDTVIATGTSGLSILKLADALKDEVKSNFFGVHLFNPPYNLTLCEVIDTKYSNQILKKELEDYLKNVLFRTVVEVKDAAGFLGNRIGFQMINQALQYAEQYQDNGGVDYIDAILGPFTGRNMPPIATADFVGLDVHKAIVDNIYQNTNDYAKDTFILPEYVENMIKKGDLGKKTGKGLYYTVHNSEDGSKSRKVYDIVTGEYREKLDYTFPFVEQMLSHIKVGDYKGAMNALVTNHSLEAGICLDFILMYIVYSMKTADEVGYDIHGADDVMATGFNWCPALAWIEALSTTTDFTLLAKKRLSDSIKKQVNLDELLSKYEKSTYDYRRFIKAHK